MGRGEGAESGEESGGDERRRVREALRGKVNYKRAKLTSPKMWSRGGPPKIPGSSKTTSVLPAVAPATVPEAAPLGNPPAEPAAAT